MSASSSEALQQKKVEPSDFCDMTSILRILKFIFLGEEPLIAYSLFAKKIKLAYI